MRQPDDSQPGNVKAAKSSGEGGRAPVALTAVLLSCQLVVLGLGIGGIVLVDTLRSYVTAEALYSKAQKEAVHALYEFASLPDEPGLVRYRELIAVPMAAREAREILEDPSRPVAEAYPLLRRMGHDPLDVRAFAWLLRLFGGTALLQPALETWRAADESVIELNALARSLQSSRQSHPLALVQRNEFLIPIAQINNDLTELQARFSRQIGEAGHRVKGAVVKGMLGFGALFLVGGIWLGARTAKRLRAAREDLEEREQRFRDIAATTADWVWETDADFRFTYISPRISQVTGFDEDHYLGRTREDMARFESETLRQAYLDDLIARRPFANVEYRLRDSEGRWRHVRTAGKPYYGRDGAFRGYRGAGSDITATRLAEASMLRARDEAEAANRAKSKFLATMSHELRTPLNAIIGFAQVISEKHLGENSPRYTDYARDIWVSGDHLLKIINEILDLSRIEAGHLKIEPEAVELAGTVERCLQIMQPEARGAQVTLVNAVDPGLPGLWVDPQRLHQILLNLVSNAIKFSKPGTEVAVSAERSENALRIAVRDHGIGMRPDEAEQVFVPFYQADGAMNRTRHGSGLGLPIVKHLIERHGGTIKLDSAPDAGTTVTLTLPIAEAAAEMKAQA